MCLGAIRDMCKPMAKNIGAKCEGRRIEETKKRTKQHANQTNVQINDRKKMKQHRKPCNPNLPLEFCEPTKLAELKKKPTHEQPKSHKITNCGINKPTT